MSDTFCAKILNKHALTDNIGKYGGENIECWYWLQKSRVEFVLVNGFNLCN